ncbi:MAG: hypothetical protein ACKVT0_20320 [Planctomycetaceae bacterium]
MVLLLSNFCWGQESPPRADENLPAWVRTGLTQKQLISDVANDTTAQAENRSIDERLKLPSWMFESGTFATVDEAEAQALKQAAAHLFFVCHERGEKFTGWSDLLNTGYSWKIPTELVRDYAVSQKHVEAKQHSFGSVTGTMYKVYLQVPNEPQRIGVFMEHRRQAISRQRTMILGIGLGIITWECLCIAVSLRVNQWSKGLWRGRVLVGAIAGGTLPLLLVIA